MNLQEWKFIQNNADSILIGGINHLNNQEYLPKNNFALGVAGNYLITLEDKPLYIGEGKIISKRLRQQFNSRTSTFYKNYMKLTYENPQPIDLFKVKVIETRIGRKEIEEIGIVNFQTSLNRFQLNKRSTYDLNENEFWNDLHENSLDFLKISDEIIIREKFIPWRDCFVESSPGVYVVKNNKGDLIYIGESSDIYDRFSTHGKTTYFSALRRHIGTEILGFDLIEKNGNGKKKYFETAQDQQVTKFLNECSAIFHPIKIGRYEIEEYLIKKYKPLLNRKDNK